MFSYVKNVLEQCAVENWVVFSFLLESTVIHTVIPVFSVSPSKANMFPILLGVTYICTSIFLYTSYF